MQGWCFNYGQDEPFDCAHSHRSGIRSGNGRAEWSVGRRGDPAPRYRVLHLHSSGITLARRRAVWKDLHAVDICLL
jgi:hypothetical protein